MERATDYSKMRGNITRPKAFNIDKLISKTEKDLKMHKDKLAELENAPRQDPVARTKRRAYIRYN